MDGTPSTKRKDEGDVPRVTAPSSDWESRWLAVPSDVRDWSACHGFIPNCELQAGHCSLVFADDCRVLKVPFQGEELTTGALAAQKLGKVGGPKVFELHRASGAQIMERIVPGTKLSDAACSDAKAFELVAGLIAPIWKLDTSECLLLHDAFEQETALLERLRMGAPSLVHLHGDLHHENVLLAGDRWVPIDPKGLYGDPHYEPVAFLRNPISWIADQSDLVGTIKKRIGWFEGRFGLTPWRIAAWGLVDQRSNTDLPEEHSWNRLVPVYEALLCEWAPQDVLEAAGL